MLKHVLTTLLLTITLQAHSQTILDSIYISKTQALEDIQQLEDRLKKNFKPYDYAHFEKEYQTRIDAVRSSLPDEITLRDFKKEIVHILESFREGHIKVLNTDPTKTNKDRKEARKKERKNPTPKLLPFELSLQGEVLRVHYDYREDSLQLNTVDSITHLGDRSIVALNAELSQHVIVDLDNDTLKNRYLATELNEVTRSLLKPHHQDSILVTYVDEGKEKTTWVSYSLRNKKEEFENFIMIDSLSTGVLNLDEFRFLNYKSGGYLNLNRVGLDSILKYNPDNLIVDLRQNRGGSARLSRKWMSSFLEQRSFLYSKNKHAFFFIPFLFSTTFKTGDRPKRAYTAKNRKGLRYKGKMYVLIDEGAFSAAMLFAKAMKNHNRAVLVGRPTGQRAYGTHAGFYKSIKLKHSEVIFNIPQLYFRTTEGRLQDIKVEGVQPDIFLPYDIDANNTETYDATIEYVLDMIAEGKS